MSSTVATAPGHAADPAAGPAPAGYRHLFTQGAAGRPQSLILAHGTGGDAASFDRFGADLAGGALQGAARLSLQGDVNEHGMARFFRRRGEGDYDMADLAARTSALDAFLAAAMGHYGLDPDQATGVGYSNGANILANLAFEKPGRLRRYLLLRPLIPFEPPQADMTNLSVLIAAGRRDLISPTALTEHLAQSLRDRGADVELSWSPGGHELDAGDVAAARRFLSA